MASARMKPLLPPPLFGLTFAGGMVALARATPSLLFDIPALDTIGLIIAAAGFALDLWSIALFIGARTTVNPLTPSRASALVIRGPYKFSRNPMYLGMLGLLTGLALWLGNPLNIALLISFVWLITILQIKPEEAALAEKFGPDYDSYRARVRRWI